MRVKLEFMGVTRTTSSGEDLGRIYLESSRPNQMGPRVNSAR